MMLSRRVLFLAYSSSFLVLFVSAAGTANAKCGACVLLIGELEKGIASSDDRKKTRVGSFRVDERGDQSRLNEIAFARSEEHVHDLLENICDKSKDYVVITHPGTGKAIYISRQDAGVIPIHSNKNAVNKLRSACDDFLDEHEDELVKFISTVVSDPMRQFCHLQLNVCSSVDVTPIPELTREEMNNDEL